MESSGYTSAGVTVPTTAESSASATNAANATNVVNSPSDLPTIASFGNNINFPTTQTWENVGLWPNPDC